MNQITAVLRGGAAVATLAVSVWARAAGPAAVTPDYTVTITPTMVSQYMFRGQHLGGASFEPVIELDSGNWGGGVWTNFLLTRQDQGTSDSEIDPYAYYSFALNASVSVIPGFTLYTYQAAGKFDGGYRATFEPNLAVSGNVGGVRLTPKVYYDLVRQSSTLELSAAYAFPLKDLGTELDFTAQGGDYFQRASVKGAAPRVKVWGQYWLAGVAAPVQITRGSRVTAGFSYTKGDAAFSKPGEQPKTPNALAVGRGVVTISYSYTF
jgi:hypothetical protein